MGNWRRNQCTHHHRGFCRILDREIIFNSSIGKTLQKLMLFLRQRFFFIKIILQLYLIILRSLRFLGNFDRFFEKDTAHTVNMGRNTCVNVTGRNLRNHQYTINTRNLDCLKCIANSYLYANKKQRNLLHAK